MITNEDSDIWQKVTESVKPLRKKSLSVPKTPTIIKKKITPIETRGESPVIRAITSSPLPQKRVKKLKNQKIPIEGRLDLHGYTLRDGHEVLISFMTQAKTRNWRCVEIITGRGDPVRGTGQLKRLVPLWLEGMSGIPILHIEPNPVSRGGSYLVLLRRSKD